ncbi:hypothetical protein EFD56_09765 [Rhizobium phaseoli]|nr:hypothetical protein EFD56_09765 [Rhizobium phaseoli]
MDRAVFDRRLPVHLRARRNRLDEAVGQVMGILRSARKTLGSYDPLTTFNVVEGEADENASFHLREEKFARCCEYMLAIFKGQGKE